MPIFHLVYQSVTSRGLDVGVLEDILTVSRELNARDGITGFLVYRDDRFIQLLEGEEARVRDCLDRIRQDRRHWRLTVIAELESEKRMMADWSMAWVPPEQPGASAAALLELFELGRGEELYSSKGVVELMLRRFSESAPKMS